ncbi:TlpA disulfide reductase family protein [Corynebacterium breve]|uniref:TlpA disulfide reductase family protein n=1 Tax=Corynebacterium breve TaxID=3049799 RepID=A0ABY8VE52_9CORY|nr:TlpA disulfide reductase family protein [Corynebacterium breve]WIM67936.1 TlpA disulfide reductase family protein [Corynebacterium breve]
MKKSVLISVVVIVVATALLVAAAISMLSDDSSGNAEGPAAGQELPAQGSSTSKIAERPDCPAEGAGGVALECLGGARGAAQQDPEHISVVNVWAWWCAPCREELPFFDEFAQSHPEYTVVGVHADTNAGNGAAMLNELGIEMASYQDFDNSFAGTLGLPNVIPVTVVFRGNDQVGFFPTPFKSVEELEEAVAEVV